MLITRSNVMDDKKLVTERRCCRCGQAKPLEEFHRDRAQSLGRDYRCKQCAAAYRQTTERKISNRQANKRYRQTTKGRMSARQANEKKRRWPKENRVKAKTNWAVARGLLARPNFCSLCGGNGKILAHHPDYDKPLEVIWVCYPCHHLLHAHNSQLKEKMA